MTSFQFSGHDFESVHRRVRSGFLCLLCSLMLAACSAAPPSKDGAHSSQLSGKASLNDLAVQDVNGVTVRPFRDEGQMGTLLFFIMNDCPVANGYAPEISRIAETYAKVRCFVVYVESDLAASAAREHAKEYAFKCGALLDPTHLLVNVTGVTVSPEAALLSPAGKLIYRGRIDDRVADVGKRRAQPIQRDLRAALDNFLTGKPIPNRRTKAIGCYIPELTSEKPVKRTIAP